MVRGVATKSLHRTRVVVHSRSRSVLQFQPYPFSWSLQSLPSSSHPSATSAALEIHDFVPWVGASFAFSISLREAGLGFNGAQMIYYLILRHVPTTKNGQNLVINLRQSRRILSV